MQPAQDLGKPPEKPIAVEIDWLRRIVFDAVVEARHCPPRSIVCRDGRVMAFRALRFSGEGTILLTDHGLVRLAYRDLAEIVMPPSNHGMPTRVSLPRSIPTATPASSAWRRGKAWF